MPSPAAPRRRLAAVAAAVTGALVATLVGPAAATVPATTSSSTHAAGDDAPPSRSPLNDVGVVTYNAYIHLRPAQLRSDMLRLVSRSDVDIVGWQEANKMLVRPRKGPSAIEALRQRGFETVTFGAAKEPISWRASDFELVSTSRHYMCDAAPRRASVRFPPKWVNVVTLRDRRTGFTLSVTNVHVAHSAEAWQSRPGRFSRLVTATCAKTIYSRLAQLWPTLPGRYVIATGDWNFDYKTDSRRRPHGGMSHVLGPLTVSNWQALGYRKRTRTVTMRQDPRPARLIDWVLVNREDVAAGRIGLHSHAVLQRYHSDHRPVLVRMHLY